MDYGVNKNTQPWSFRQYPTSACKPHGYSGALSHDYDKFHTDLTRDPRSGSRGPEISGRYEYQQRCNAFYAWKRSRENMSEAEKTRMEQPDKTDPDMLRVYRNALKFEKDLPEFERKEAEEYIKIEEEREKKYIDDLVKNIRATAPALPYGWRQHRSKSGTSGSTQPKFFYKNVYTKGVQWELPTQAAAIDTRRLKETPEHTRLRLLAVALDSRGLKGTPEHTRLRLLAAARMKLEDEEAIKRAIEKQERKESRMFARKIAAEGAQAATEEIEREESIRLQKEQLKQEQLQKERLKQEHITIGTTIDNKMKLIKQISERSHKMAASAAQAATEEMEREECTVC